jgi:hypothetical protein
MTKATKTILSILFLTLFIAAGDTRAQQWYDGAVVLSDQRVVIGAISRQSRDLILVKNAKGVAVYPAHRVTSFRYFDGPQNINRKFISGSTSQTGPLRFFEVVVEGRINVLREQLVFSETMNEEASDPGEACRYLLSGGGEGIVPINSFRKKYFNMIRSELGNSRLLGMDTHEAADIIRMVLLYNHEILTPSIAGIADDETARDFRSK